MNGNSYHTINIQVQVQSFCVTKLSKCLISNESLVLVVCFTYILFFQINWINIDSNIGIGIAILFAKSIDIVLAIHF